MIIVQDPAISDSFTCSYLPEQESRYEYFFASGLNEIELNDLLAGGWRKFGYYYFRPACHDCCRCIPLRVNTGNFVPSRSQKKLWKRNKKIIVRFNPLEYRDEIFDIYADHSINRFGTIGDRDEFMFHFYYQSCPALQSEYYYEDRLIAVGFLDKTHEGLSSVYFVYRSDSSRLSMGTYSALAEIEYARRSNLLYYYLGYWVPENHFMAYKDRFQPNEKYSWGEMNWKAES